MKNVLVATIVLVLKMISVAKVALVAKLNSIKIANVKQVVAQWKMKT